MKEASETHRRAIATEPPRVLHAPACVNETLCEQHWRGTWWNGMGRFLMDGRSKLSFDEALSRFMPMNFGEMGAECKQATLKFVQDGDGFDHARELVAAYVISLDSSIYATSTRNSN